MQQLVCLVPLLPFLLREDVAVHIDACQGRINHRVVVAVGCLVARCCCGPSCRSIAPVADLNVAPFLAAPGAGAGAGVGPGAGIVHRYRRRRRRRGGVR
jgi:hypothetical protein